MTVTGRCCHPQFQMRIQRLGLMWTAQSHVGHSLRIWLQNKHILVTELPLFSVLLYFAYDRGCLQVDKQNSDKRKRLHDVAEAVGWEWELFHDFLSHSQNPQLNSSRWPAQRFWQSQRNLHQTQRNLGKWGLRVPSCTIGFFYKSNLLPEFPWLKYVDPSLKICKQLQFFSFISFSCMVIKAT